MASSYFARSTGACWAHRCYGSSLVAARRVEGRRGKGKGGRRERALARRRSRHSRLQPWRRSRCSYDDVCGAYVGVAAHQQEMRSREPRLPRCKKADENPAACLKQGKEVTSCVISLSVHSACRGPRTFHPRCRSLLLLTPSPPSWGLNVSLGRCQDGRLALTSLAGSASCRSRRGPTMCRGQRPR